MRPISLWTVARRQPADVPGALTFNSHCIRSVLWKQYVMPIQ
jgi:hypothetical protein